MQRVRPRGLTPGERFVALVVSAVLLAAGLAAAISLRDGPSKSRGGPSSSPTGDQAGDAANGSLPGYLGRACDLPFEWLVRINRGWDPSRERARDLIIVPKPPNYMGTFINTSHSGPYGFLQHVPLILRGPGHIRPRGEFDLGREVTIADLAPTYAQLMSFEWHEREGRPISEVLATGASPPKLIVTISIDGGGWNVLNRWPNSWPNLNGLIREGASIGGATVGSSPSITPATHTNISTGTFPRRHGVTAIAVRTEEGDIVGAFSEQAQYTGAEVDPDLNLRSTTIGDDWDRYTNNRALIGLVAAGNYPLGMLGRGGALRGGDKDLALLLDEARTGAWATTSRYYTLPTYVNELPGPDREIRAVDRADGISDGRWMGHDLDATGVGNTPAAALYEARVIEALVEREGFGSDDTTDLLYVHFKSPDHAGHRWNMISPEMGEVIASVDTAIGRLMSLLDRSVGADDYVIAITADHGQTPLEAGGWAISRAELVADIQTRFDETPNGIGVLERTSATSFFVDREEMSRNDIGPGQLSGFISDYTIGDNIPKGEPVPEGFQERTDEPIFLAAFPGRTLSRVLRCATRP